MTRPWRGKRYANGRPQVATGKTQIGVDNSDQCQIGEMMSLSRHLRADDDIHLARGDR